MHSIEILEANRGTSHQDEAAAIVLTRAQKHVTDARAMDIIGDWIEDLMRGKITSHRSAK